MTKYFITPFQKFEVSTVFLYVFERSLLCSPRLHLFDQKYIKNSNMVKYYYNFKQLFSICIFF